MPKYIPAVLGALCLVAFAAVLWWPAALATAGVLLLALDHRIDMGSDRKRDET